MKTFRSFVAIILMVTTGVFPLQAAYSQTVSPAPTVCERTETVMPFINGVTTPYMGSSLSVLRLIEEYGNTSKGKRLSIVRFYNPTAPMLGDFFETFNQFAKEHPEVQGKWETLWLAVRGASTRDIFYLSASGALQVAFAEAALLKIKTKTLEMLSEKNLLAVDAEFVKKVTAYMLDRKKVVVVSHSQGNLFAHTLFNGIKPRLAGIGKSVAIFVHVAPPTDLTNGAYFTNRADKVINSARLSINPNIPAGNMTIEPTVFDAVNNFSLGTTNNTYLIFPDFLGHGFVETYLNRGRDDHKLVTAGIAKAMDDVEEYPCELTSPLNLAGAAINGSVGTCRGTLKITGVSSIFMNQGNERLLLKGTEDITLSCYQNATAIDMNIPLTRVGNNFTGTAFYPFNCREICNKGSTSVSADFQFVDDGGKGYITGSISYKNTNDTPFSSSATNQGAMKFE